MSTLIFDATSAIGRRSVAALLAAGQRDVLLASQDAQGLAQLAAETGLKQRLVTGAPSVGSAAQDLLRGVKVVVLCTPAGEAPHAAWVGAAMAARAHVLDTEGDQQHMLSVAERYHGAARLAELAVVSAHGFEFSLGSCAGALLAEAEPGVERLEIFTRFNDAGGLRLSPLGHGASLAELLAPSLERIDGVLKHRVLPALPRRVHFPGAPGPDFAVPFPGGEAIHLVKQHAVLRSIHSYLVLPREIASAVCAVAALRRLGRGQAAPALQARLQQRLAGAEPALRGEPALIGETAPRGETALPSPQPSPARSTGLGFQVLARSGRRAATGRQVTLSGCDPLELTAQCVAAGVRILLKSGPQAVGVVSTDHAFGAERFLQALAPSGLLLTRER